MFPVLGSVTGLRPAALRVEVEDPMLFTAIEYVPGRAPDVAVAWTEDEEDCAVGLPWAAVLILEMSF